MNQYRQLLRLLPSDPLLVGTVTASNSDGTVDVELPDGKVIRVRGSASVNARVFVRGGELRGPAPTLTVQTAELPPMPV